MRNRLLTISTLRNCIAIVLAISPLQACAFGKARPDYTKCLTAPDVKTADKPNGLLRCNNTPDPKKNYDIPWEATVRCYEDAKKVRHCDRYVCYPLGDHKLLEQELYYLRNRSCQ